MEEYDKEIVAVEKEEVPIENGWNIAEVVIPDGPTFRLAFKGNTLRIRKATPPYWVPVEEEFIRRFKKDNLNVLKKIVIKCDI